MRARVHIYVYTLVSIRRVCDLKMLMKGSAERDVSVVCAVARDS